MKSIIDPAPGDMYASADYETLESRAAGVRASSGGEVTEANARAGLDTVYDQRASGIPNAVPTVIDANHDWRDRVIEVLAFSFSSANERPGGSADYTDWSTIGGGTPAVLAGYLGTGALSNVGTGAAVANGAPPVAGTGGGGTSYRLTIGANLYLYADPTSGSLSIYNATGAAVHAWLRVTGTADLNRH